MTKLGNLAAPMLILAGVALMPRQGPTGDERPHEQQGELAAAEADRGRLARSPQEIPPKGWKDILLRTRKEFAEDQVPMIAAGVTFFTLLAVFPGLAVLVSLYGLFADVSQAQRQVAALSAVIPGGALQLIGDQMVRLAAANKGGLSIGLAVGLAVAIWSANGAMKAMMTGLNIAYEEHEKRSFLRKILTSLAFTLGFIVFGMGAIALLGAAPAIEAIAGHGAALAVTALTWLVLLIVLGVGMALLYRYGPSRSPVKLKWITWGSAASLIVWLVVSVAFSLYVANFGSYDKTYGSLGAAVGFMTWLYLSNLVVLAGAELNAEIEHQTAVDTTGGHPKPAGARGAKVADTVGAAQP